MFPPKSYLYHCISDLWVVNKKTKNTALNKSISLYLLEKKNDKAKVIRMIKTEDSVVSVCMCFAACVHDGFNSSYRSRNTASKGWWDASVLLFVLLSLVLPVIDNIVYYLKDTFLIMLYTLDWYITFVWFHDWGGNSYLISKVGNASWLMSPEWLLGWRGTYNKYCLFS